MELELVGLNHRQADDRSDDAEPGFREIMGAPSAADDASAPGSISRTVLCPVRFQVVRRKAAAPRPICDIAPWAKMNPVSEASGDARLMAATYAQPLSGVKPPPPALRILGVCGLQWLCRRNISLGWFVIDLGLSHSFESDL